MNDSSIQRLAQEVIELEAAAVSSLTGRLDERFHRACELLRHCEGRVVVVGMGKSGHVAGKLASTFASTGTPAFFVHPGEASHGDLGMITPVDLLVAISNSGENPEILMILPIIKRMGVKLIALTGNPESTLARQADVSLDVGVEKEACPMNLAPTASTMAAMAMGDALAMVVFKLRGFTEKEFARSHPGGILGRRLLLYVSDIMHQGDAIPLVRDNDTLAAALLEMSGKTLGMTGVVDEHNRLCGIFTDGDLRRTLSRDVDVKTCRIADVMTRNPKTTGPDTLAAEVVRMMRTQAINGIFVIDDSGAVIGALNMHDLLRAGVV